MSQALPFATTLCLFATTVLSFAAVPSKPAPVDLPLVFEMNRGQTAAEVQYVARSRDGSLFFTAKGVTVAVPRHGSFRLLFEGAATSSPISPEQQLPGRSNYLRSNPKNSIIGVPTYGALRYRRPYPGTDVRFYGRNQHLEYELMLAPGVDPGQAMIRLEGIDSVGLDKNGDAKLALGDFTLTESAPVAWQVIAGKRVRVTAAWKLFGENRLGFRVGAYDHARPLTIDPVLAYSTHHGGSTAEDQTAGTTFAATTEIRAVALDSNGNIYVAGTTTATDFPTTAGAYKRSPNFLSIFHDDTFSFSGFVSKFDKTGKILIYSTFLHSGINKLAVDAGGHAYTAKGGSDSFAGPNEGFDDGVAVDKLSADGSRLLYSLVFAETPLNSPNCEAFGDSFPGGIAADNVGHVWVAGSTENPCMPTTPGAFQRTLKDTDGFIVKLDTTKSGTASIVYSSYLGGSGVDFINAMTVDSLGNAYVAGRTDSTDFPHSAAFGSDPSAVGFVSKVNDTGSALLFSSLVRGVTSFIPAVAIDSFHNVYLAGTTQSAGFPTTPNAFRRTITNTNCPNPSPNPAPCLDGFVTKLSSGGAHLLYSTLLGGGSNDSINGLAVTGKGMAFVTGATSSTDFPTTASAFKRTLIANSTNAFVTALNTSGQSLYYSTLLGGTTNTSGDAITLNRALDAFVVGETADANFPVTSNAFQPSLNGARDGFLAKVVIAGDLRLSLRSNVTNIAHNGTLIFYEQVTNLGPDGSDNVLLTDRIPSGFAFSAIYTNSASSCLIPAKGATTGSVVCRKTRLARGQSIWVNVYLRAVAPSGSTLTNRASASAQTQDLKQSNNAAQISVHVQ